MQNSVHLSSMCAWGLLTCTANEVGVSRVQSCTGTQYLNICSLSQVWSGSSDGSTAVTDLDVSARMDTALARSLKTPTNKGMSIVDMFCKRHVAATVLHTCEKILH